MANIRRILVLGSYPCVKPLHGGQIRLSEIIAAYRSAGFQVQSVNLYDAASAAGQPAGRHDIDYPRDTPWRHWRGRVVPLIEDLTSGRYAANDQHVYQKLTDAIKVVPDVIHLEQPWLLPLVQRWRQEGKIPHVRLVYSSQNIEAPLKKAILQQYGLSEADEIAEEIAALEAQACREADIVLAVSETDRRLLSKLTSSPVILAANGIAPWHADSSTLGKWKPKLPDTPFALFVGSAHPPNMTGFFEMMGDSLGFLPPDRQICVAGSVGPNLLEHPVFQHWLPLNQSRLRILGLLDDADLAAVKVLAHVFVLPITEGGGSNIKTAEALFSGKHVLGTPVSFRSFEYLLAMPGVHVAATPADFRRELQLLLHVPPLALNPDWDDARRGLLWKNTLVPMVATVKSLCA